MLDPDNAVVCDDYDCSSMIDDTCNLESRCGTYRHVCLDKENNPQNLSPMKHESDLSLYSNSSPGKITCCSLGSCLHQKRILEDHDPNSRDSGYGPGCPNEGNKFYQFARSLGVTPRQAYSSTKVGRLSFESTDSMDDAFLELADFEQPTNENAQLPVDFNTLMTGRCFVNARSLDISPELDFGYKPTFRRSISLNSSVQTPSSSRVRSCLFKREDADFRSFKRPERPEEPKSPVQNKRSRVEQMFTDDVVVPQKPTFERSLSVSEESIKLAVHRSFVEPDLIGDFSRSYCLPLVPGKHQDLKSIMPKTLSMLMKGEYRSTVHSYTVIDCRYPYEYHGGHIDGAINLYTKEQILEHLLDVKSSSNQSLDKSLTNILVFHCEFSSERGPTLSRFLRNWDRAQNSNTYPALRYPEIYLLEGGYKSFFEKYSELCVPNAYLPMLDPDHSKDLKLFRSKSKLWNEGRYKESLKRLELQ